MILRTGTLNDQLPKAYILARRYARKSANSGFLYQARVSMSEESASIEFPQVVTTTSCSPKRDDLTSTRVFLLYKTSISRRSALINRR